MGEGLRGVSGGPASPPYTQGPYTWDQHVTFSQGAGFSTGEGSVWYVDGTNGSSGNNAKSWTTAIDTIQGAVTLAGPGDTIYVTAKDLTDFTGDPTSYAETIIIPAATSNLSIIGVSRGQTQGGLPQIRIGAGSTAMLTIRAPGCLIANLGFNGISSTGGGILLDDDYATKAAFGTTIIGCHFKNCVATTTVAASGGAIYTTTAGNCWQCNFIGNHFYKNQVDICLRSTTNTQPQDWVIKDNIFSGPAANVNCNLFLSGTGNGVNGVIIDNNIFPCDPALSTGDINTTCSLTGCVGIYSNNMHGHTGLTLGDGTVTGGIIPATVFMVNNYQEGAIITRTS